MIIENKIDIKLTKRIVNRYNGNLNDIITINVEDLPKSSTNLITAKCDICGDIRKLEYRLYMKNYNKYKLYTCYNCCKIKYKKTSMLNYGVENPMQDDSIKDKLKQVFLEKYGTEYYLKSDDKKKKSLDTCLIKYGSEYPMQNEIIQNKVIKTKKEKYGENFEKITEKIIETKKEKYGIDLTEIKEKIINTNNIKYGCDYPLQNIDIYNKSIVKMFELYNGYPMQNITIKNKQILANIDTTFKNIKNKNKDLTFISKNKEIYTIYCEKCKNNYDINFNLFHLRKMSDTTLCTICNNPKDKHSSDFQNKVIEFLEQNNINFSINDRKCLNGKEIDILLNDYNIAIECNGLYWHSELYKTKKYHKEKTDNCKKNNIDLIHIWEDDWKLKNDTVKSIILNKLHKTKNKIYARKCEIMEITDNTLIQNFLNDNHIQGYVKSNLKIGLFYNKELVSLMTFGNRKINTNVEYELIRFCNKKFTTVIGAANKLFKNFINKINTSMTVISYSDNSMFNGNMYRQLGFEYVRDTELNYYWIVNNVREHRFKYNKKRLIALGNDKNKSEYEIMSEKGYFRLWSCGMKKWKYEIKEINND